MDDQIQYHETLEEHSGHILFEVRIVAPGVQALFGFPCTVVFSDGFKKLLSHQEQVVHLNSTGIVAFDISFLLHSQRFADCTNLV